MFSRALFLLMSLLGGMCIYYYIQLNRQDSPMVLIFDEDSIDVESLMETLAGSLDLEKHQIEHNTRT